MKAPCKVRKRLIDCSMALHCTTPTRIDLLFTMSDNPQHALSEQRVQSDVSRTKCVSVRRPARLRPVGLRRGSLRALSTFPSRTYRARSAGLPSRSAKRREGWWSLSGSNRRPHACKARALPAELRPHDRRDECVAADRRDDFQPEVHVDQSAFALTGYGATAFAHLLACRAEAPDGAKAGGPGKT